MPEVKRSKAFLHEDVSERDWQPRVCIKMTCLHKMWLRSLLISIVRCRVDGGRKVTIDVDEDDFTYLMEIIAHMDNARFIKSSIEPLTQYGGADNPAHLRRER